MKGKDRREIRFEETRARGVGNLWPRSKFFGGRDMCAREKLRDKPLSI